MRAGIHRSIGVEIRFSVETFKDGGLPHHEKLYQRDLFVMTMILER